MTTKFFKYAGIAASIVLIAFGIGSIVTGLNGRSTVHDNLGLEQITGSPDMNPAAIAAEAKAAGLKGVALPTCSVANQAIDTGGAAPGASPATSASTRSRRPADAPTRRWVST